VKIPDQLAGVIDLQFVISKEGLGREFPNFFEIFEVRKRFIFLRPCKGSFSFYVLWFLQSK